MKVVLAVRAEGGTTETRGSVCWPLCPHTTAEGVAFVYAARGSAADYALAEDRPEDVLSLFSPVPHPPPYTPPSCLYLALPSPVMISSV